MRCSLCGCTDGIPRGAYAIGDEAVNFVFYVVLELGFAFPSA
jgi:hypothetical protein